MSWFKKTFSSLKNTSNLLKEVITSFSGNKKLDQTQLDNLEEVFIQSDMGWELSEKLIDDMKYLDKQYISWEDQLFDKICNYVNHDFDNINFKKVIMLVGVNGTGKTTSAAKLANYFCSMNEKVMLVAADTFRAAAEQQLSIWSQKAGVKLISNTSSNDAASIVFDGIQSGLAGNYDRIIIDTAGRIHNSKNLMNELEKIHRVGTKLVEESDIFITIDANTGQNALSQVESFNSIIPLSGIILTKMDGTAKGGIALSILEKKSIPINFIGLGEKIDDLIPFNLKDYVMSLLGKERLKNNVS